jgi:hypothetical protein
METAMKSGEALLLGMAVVGIGVIPADLLYTSRFVPRFKEIEKERIVTSNQLATAKIVSENLKHVRELVFDNLEFAGQKDSISQETELFDFLTSCVNDLKMRLVSVRPTRPETVGRVTTSSYEIQLEGDFFSFGELCSKFENSRRVMAITSFEVVNNTKEPSSSSVTKPTDLKSAPDSRLGRRSVLIRIHLDTFRVKKG